VLSIWRQKVWTLMRKQQVVEVTDLIEIGASKSGWTQYAMLLSEAAYLDTRQRGRLKQYQLIRDTGAGAPIVIGNQLYDQNLAGYIQEPRTRIWRCLQSLKEFDRLEVERFAKVGSPMYHKFVIDLVKADYLLPLGKESRDSCIRYRLVRDTGQLAPIRIEPGVLWDANKDVVYPEEFQPNQLNQLSNCQGEKP
jgi:hypothetical protein